MRKLTVGKAVVAGTLAPLVLAACGGSGSSDGSSSPIVLGTSLSMTGPLGAIGLDLKDGYQQLIDDVNATGGIEVDGTKRQVTLKVLDNRSDPNTATQQIRELVLKDDVDALLGGCTPPIVIPEALAAEQLRVPFVTSCNPIQAFRSGNESGWKYSWDLFFDEKDQAETVAAGLAMATSNKKVALFTDTEPDGVVERGLYKEAFAAAGLEIVGDYTFPVGTSDFSSFISDAKSKGAELVAGQMIPPDGIALWKQMKALNYKPTQAFVSKASVPVAWVETLGDTAEGTLTEGFWSPESGKANSRQLVTSALGEKYAGTPDLGIALQAYTAADVLTDAIGRAGSTDPDEVNDAIAETDDDFPLGHIKFDSTHTATTPYLLMQWQDGKTVQVLPALSESKLQVPVRGLN